MKYYSSRFQHSLFQALIRLQRTQQQEGGYSLVVTVAMLLILSTLLISAAVVSKVDTASTNASARSSNGFFAAEAGLNIRAKEIKERFEGFNRPDGVTPTDYDGDGEIWDDCADGSTQGTNDFRCNSVTFQGQDVITYVEELGQDNNLDGIPDDLDGDGDPDPLNITIPLSETFGGLSAQEYRYQLSSVAQNGQGLPSALLGMTFKSRVVPMFQFLAFFNKDFELAYPPTMNLNGPIHANGDVYINSGAGRTLTINGQITSAETIDEDSGGTVISEGTLFRGLKFQNSCTGTVRVHAIPSGTPSIPCSGSRVAYTETQQSLLDTTWGKNTIKVDFEELQVPPPEDFDPAAGKPYWDDADLRIVLDVTGSTPTIEVRERGADNTSYGANDNNATIDLLNTCPADTTNFSYAATTTLANQSGNPNYNGTERFLYVSDDLTATLERGDVIRVGNDDDNNVVRNVTSSYIELDYPLGTSQTAGSSTVISKAIASTTDKFFNNREKRGSNGIRVRMLEIDVQALIDCAHTSNLMGKGLDDDSEGGLLWYLTVQGPNSNSLNNYGVRVRNGSQLASSISGAPDIKGLTIVSDQALYVQGNYNCLPISPSNSNATQPGDCDGRLKKPAAFLVDTINVLSEGWNIYKDKYSTQNVTGGNRTADETTVYAAFLSGSDTTGDVEGVGGQNQGFNASYGGGFENYPRFHEYWTGTAFNYRGSFVTLNKPRKANGKWCGTGNGCNIYTPPLRNWDFDQDFRNASKLPPASPRFVYLRQELFERDFTRSAYNPNKVLSTALSTIQPNFSL